MTQFPLQSINSHSHPRRACFLAHQCLERPGPAHQGAPPVRSWEPAPPQPPPSTGASPPCTSLRFYGAPDLPPGPPRNR